MSQKLKSITIAGQKFEIEQNSEIDLAGKADLVEGKVPVEQLPEETNEYSTVEFGGSRLEQVYTTGSGNSKETLFEFDLSGLKNRINLVGGENLFVFPVGKSIVRFKNININKKYTIVHGGIWNIATITETETTISKLVVFQFVESRVGTVTSSGAAGYTNTKYIGYARYLEDEGSVNYISHNIDHSNLTNTIENFNGVIVYSNYDNETSWNDANISEETGWSYPNMSGSISGFINFTFTPKYFFSGNKVAYNVEIYTEYGDFN